MTYLPDRLPKDAGAVHQHILQNIRRMSTGKAIPGMGPPPPPYGKELQDQLAEKIVTGDVVYWRRGPQNSGLRYEFQAVFWWRAVERLLNGATNKLEGTMAVEVCDESDPSEWKLNVVPDPPDPHATEKPPKGKELDSLM